MNLQERIRIAAREALISYIRLFFPDFELADHHKQIIDLLRAVESGKLKRLIITAPPRSGKSTLVSEFFPCWALGKDPTRQIISCSYGDRLTAEFGNKVKQQLLSDIFKYIFPECTTLPDTKSAHRINTHQRGSYFATSIGGVLTGRGADILIIDDPVKDRQTAESELYQDNTWNWYTSTAKTRLQPGGAIIIMATRWVENDLSGILLDTQGEQWEHLHLKAISDDGRALWPSWFDLSYLYELRKESEYDFNALYQGEPAPRSGNFFKVDNINMYNGELEQAKKDNKHIRIIQSVDTATKTGKLNDYSVISTWAECESLIYLVDVWRDKVEYPVLRESLKTQYKKHNPECCLIEDASAGTQMLQELRESNMVLIPIKPITDKVTRSTALQSAIEAGKIYFPKDADFLPDVMSEMRAFPNARYDDFCDTASMAYNKLYQSKHVGQSFRNPLFTGQNRKRPRFETVKVKRH